MSTKKVLTVQDVKDMGGRISSLHEPKIIGGSIIGDGSILSEIVLNDGSRYIPTSIKDVSITIITGANSSNISAQNIWINKNIANKFYDIVESGEDFDSFFVSTSSTLSVNNVVPKGYLFFHKASGRWISNSRTGIQITELIKYTSDEEVDYDQTLRKDLLDSTILNADAPHKMIPIFTNIEVVGDGLDKSCNQMLCEGEVGRVLSDEKVYIEVLSTYPFPATVKSKRISSISNFTYRVNGGNIIYNDKSDSNIHLGKITRFASYVNNSLGTFKEEDIIEAYPIPTSGGLLGSVVSVVTVETFTGTNYTGTKTDVTLFVDQDISRNTCIVAVNEGLSLIPTNIITIHANTSIDKPPTGNEDNITKYNLSANIGIRGLYASAYFDSLKFIITDLSSINSTPTTIYADCEGDVFTTVDKMTESIGSFPNGHNLSLRVEATIMISYGSTLNYHKVAVNEYYTTFDGITKTVTNVVLNGGNKTIDIEFVLSDTSTNVRPI